MALLRTPFRRLSEEVSRASRESRWRALGTLLDRNFSEIERWLASTSAYPNKRVYTIHPSVNRSTSSTTYVNWPVGEVLSASFTKRLASTRLVITLLTSARMTGAAAETDYAVSINSGTDTPIREGVISTINTHYEQVGAIEVTGLAAGAHTIVLRAKISDPAGTLNVDNNNQVRLVIEEVA